MKIAFVSFEYPPDTAFGGIATYVSQAARVLSRRGHQVEVFAATDREERETQEGDIRVHRVHATTHESFAQEVARLFATRHDRVQFDVLEGPEYGADTRDVVKVAPEIPLVIKLHTPMFLVNRLNSPELSFATRVRATLGAWRRGIRPWWHYDRASDAEYAHAHDADMIAAPSHAIARVLMDEWSLPAERICLVPYPYEPSAELLNIPEARDGCTVLFYGRLEARKGVVTLADAIPEVLRQCPQTRFMFVGRPMSSPRHGQNMREFLQSKLRGLEKSVEFHDAVPLDEVPKLLGDADICVFPSVWESFGLVCLEAMAAARAVIATGGSGMSELLGDAGLLVPPRDARRLAHAMMSIVSEHGKRLELGHRARERVLREYNSTRIGALQEDCYRKAIENRHRAGSRERRTGVPRAAMACGTDA